jgi:hypothetical protein
MKQRSQNYPDLPRTKAEKYEFMRQRQQRKKRLKRDSRKTPAHVKAEMDTSTS